VFDDRHGRAAVFDRGDHLEGAHKVENIIVGDLLPVQLFEGVKEGGATAIERRMLVRIMEALESVPEGSGTMMDHTLIVYTSNNADSQHTNGANWPVMLLGNFNGAIKTGCFTQLDGKRPINAFYATLLRAAGQNCDRFNMNDKLAKKFDASTGPVKELLV
jgi:hypothetical protein